MTIKIYFNDKPLFLCDEMNKEIDRYVHRDDTVFIDDFSLPAVNSIIHEMRQEKVHAGIFLHRDLETLRKAFWKKFLLVQAAGGLVENEKGDLLLMMRRGKWYLPKGKLDAKETLEHCAVREVEEETGLRNIHLGSPLLVTYHTYDENGKHFLKESHWYRMTVSGAQTLVPQEEEQITEVKWVGAASLGEITGNTFPSIIDALQAAGYL
jgi:8-oxo-dGTP pyrophosphatase MutT (NUDIX family)